MGRVGLGWVVINLLVATSLVANVLARNGVHVPRQGQLMLCYRKSCSECHFSATSSSSASSASPTPTLSFINWDSFLPISCQSIGISWFYAGPRGTINLNVTNRGVSQSDPAPSPSSTSVTSSSGVGSRIITINIGRNIGTLTYNFTWSSVNVPPGWYIIGASMPAFSFNAASEPFFVSAGPDQSCLSSFFSSASTSPTAGSIASSPVSNPNPMGASSRSGGIGVILSACLGGAALSAFILACCLLFIKKRRKQKSLHRKDDNNFHRWSGLGSTDSRGGFANHRPGNDSIGTTVFLHGSEEAAMAEKSSVLSKEQPSSFGEHDALSTLPVLTHQQRPTETVLTHSLSPSTANSFLAANNTSTPTRDSSVNNALPNRMSMESFVYPPTLPNSAVKNMGQDLQSRLSGYEASPRTPRPRSYTTGDAVKQEYRQSYGRKRKPVPVYDPSLEHVSPSVPSAPPLPVSVPPVWPSPSPDPLSYSPPPTSSSVSHYIRRTHSIQDFGQSELAHRNSLGPGSKPLHYLIPDRPLAQK